jgi:2'-5' RNA ligase
VSRATRRLFFALWPSAEARARLVASVAPVIEGCGGIPVPMDNLHLTLVFLGSVPEEQLADVRAVAAGIRVPPIAVTLDQIEYWRKPQMLCATASAPAPDAAALATSLFRALVEQEFSPDSKPFRVHLTLVRKAGRAVAPLPMPPVRMEFEDFALIESRTESTGAAYSVLGKWPLYKRQDA